jgi:hypothetical protein
MKPTVYIPTLLALIIHVMVYGQTSETTLQNMNRVSSEVRANERDYTRLVKAADYYDRSSKKIKDESHGRQAKETELMEAESKDFNQISLLKQIEASELAEKLNAKAFENNNRTIGLLFAGRSRDVDSRDQANTLVADANKAMNTAILLRMEARQMTNFPAKAGYMGNAEEKEFIALSKQEKAIGVLEKAVAAAMFDSLTDLVCK